MVNLGETIRCCKGSYKIFQMLKVGGQSIVWLGLDSTGEEKVVIKHNKSEKDDLALSKLKTGAQILKDLSHPYIERYVDELDLGSTFYLVTDFIEGDTFEKKFLGHPMNEDEAVDTALKLLEAVDYIHSCNVIHRDIKPKNLMGETTLIDFGTAKRYYTKGGPEAIRSPGGYAAPEQCLGNSFPQSDLWSVGAVLYFLLTGKHPLIFMSDYPDRTMVMDPKKVVRGLSEQIAFAIKKALSHDMAERFSTAKEMAEILMGEGEVETVICYPRLVIENGSSYDLKDRSMFIVGRGSQSDIVLHEQDPSGPYISTEHAKIFEKNGRWYLQDVGSLNGTAVYRSNRWMTIFQGKKVGARHHSKPFELNDGDVISFAYDEEKGPYLTAQFKIVA